MPLEWLALLAACSSATAHLALKKGVGTGTPAAFLAARWSISAVATTLILLLGPGWANFHLSGPLLLLVAGSVIGPVLGYLLYLRALPRLDVSVAQPIFNSSVLVTMLLAVVFLEERPNLFTLLGAALILVGVQSLQQVGGAKTSRSHWRLLYQPTVLLVLGGAVCLGVSSFFFKIGLVQLTPAETNWVRTTVPSLVLLGGNALVEARMLLAGARKRVFLTRRGFALAALASVANDLVGWQLRLTALKFGQVVIVEPLASTSPLFVALLSTLLLGERLGRRGWLGVGTTVLGAALLGSWGR